GVGQTGPNGVDAPLEWPENVAGPRVTRELPIVVPNHTNHNSRSKFESRSPLEMKFVAALVVGRRILDVEGDPCSSIQLQFFCAVGPRKSPARIDPWPIETGNGREAALPVSRRGDSLHVDEMRESSVLPSKLKPRHDVAHAPTVYRSRAAEPPPKG